MVDPSYNSTLLTQFGGAWHLEESQDVPINKGLISENTSFIPGKALTRLGFSEAFDANEEITGMFNWISSLGNLLVWYRSADRAVRLANIDAPDTTTETVIAGDLIGYGAIFADAGARLYLSFFNTSATGASGARVISYQNAAFVNDLCFLPPTTYTPSAPAEPGAGSITAGIHYLGYRIEYRSGFITRPSPDSGVGNPSSATFLPVTFTASGGANAAWTLNTTWPTGAVRVHVIMTPVANPADWRYVTGAYADVVGGTLQSVTITFDITDSQLFATGPSASNSLFLMTNTVGGTPQILPSVCLPLGDRMGYVATIADNVGNRSGALYISNKNLYQEITPDTSLIQIPGLKNITTGISLDGTLYIFGPQWTYRTIDNGAEPSTWPAPSIVDGRRGTLAPRGAVVSPAGTYAWVASQDGLYFFQGAFPQIPISYHQQPIWNRINWNAAHVVDIADDPTVKKVYVMVALDDAESPSHLLTWDYTNGFDPDVVNFSLDFIQSYSMGAMAVVKNSLPDMPEGVPQTKELWLAPSTPAPILRRNSTDDVDPYLDNTFPIFSTFKTSMFPHLGTARGQVFQHHGADFRVTGSGNLQIFAYTLDDAQEKELSLIALSTQPGQVPHRGYNMIGEGVSYFFTQGANLIADPDFEGEMC